MEAIEPRLVIPMYFADGDTKLNITGAVEFLKIVGKTELQPEAKYSLKSKSELSDLAMEFVLLEAK